MKIGIPREVAPGERRVAATPETAKRLQKLGFTVLLQRGAGEGATYPDVVYESAGVTLIDSADQLWEEADWVLKVREPADNPDVGKHERDYLKPGKGLISFLYPSSMNGELDGYAETGATMVAMDQVPRITRAQKMDALSSMANIAGYRAVIEAANHFPRFFTGQITAAGKVPPAKVLVIGAGVAGLAAIGAARGLGAIVRAFDVRPSVKEQVQSMGAEFLEVEMEESGEGSGGYAKEMSKEFIEAEMRLFKEQAAEVDIIITTALIPGRPAPKLILEEAVREMRPGSVVVDLAAEQGGNCELTEPGEVCIKYGVTIIGVTDLPSRMAAQSSQLYGTNLCHLLDDMGGAEKFAVNLEDEVVRGATVVHQGKVLWPPPKVEPSPQAKAAPALPTTTAPTAPTNTEKGRSPWNVIGAIFVIVAMAGASQTDAQFLGHFSVFVLAIIVGWMVVSNVSHALHTPLMSVTNAISGIILVGGMLQIGALNSITTWLGAVAVFVATINISGGFLVTQRMLKMFRKDG